MNKFGNPLDSTRRHTERKSGDTLVHWMELNLWSDTSCNLSDKTGILNWNTSILNWNTSILNWNTSILNWNTSFLYYNTGNLNNFGTSFDFTQRHTERIKPSHNSYFIISISSSWTSVKVQVNIFIHFWDTTTSKPLNTKIIIYNQSELMCLIKDRSHLKTRLSTWALFVKTFFKVW